MTRPRFSNDDTRMRVVIISVTLVLTSVILGCASSARQSVESNTEQDKLVQLRAFIDGLVAERDRRVAAGEPVGLPRLQAEIAKLRQDFNARVQEDFKNQVEQELGIAPEREETVTLEAIDADGNTVEIPYTTNVRPLRNLTDARVRRGAQSLMDTDSLALDLYDIVPEPIVFDDRIPFRRHYTGEHARAIAMEARLIVELKGGEWAEPPPGGRVANAIAVRGLDLDIGFKENTNQRYDDTMYIVIDYADGASETYEYRMTTESSSNERGVGRLHSRQVTYVRGLHRGKDPAFRLKGNSARGSRVGREGEFDIVGANIHSAYSRRPITSESPLPNNVSLGCQVIAAGKADFETSFIQLLDAKGIKQFLYTIVANGEVEVFNELVTNGGQQSVLIDRLPRPQRSSPPAGA